VRLRLLLRQRRGQRVSAVLSRHVRARHAGQDGAQGVVDATARVREVVGVAAIAVVGAVVASVRGAV
jgi:hypothetical protein